LCITNLKTEKMSQEILREETIKGKTQEVKLQIVKYFDGLYDRIEVMMYYTKENKNFVKNIWNPYNRKMSIYFNDLSQANKEFSSTIQCLKLGIKVY